MDKHLNCFYSYNHDEELIENNLTRAFILTLMGISSSTRNVFLQSLHPTFKKYDYTYANFALQDNIDVDISKFKNRYIVGVSSSTDYEGEDKIKERKPIEKNTQISITDSIPDAWIYDNRNADYCFLVECKKPPYVNIQYSQLVRHAYTYYNWDEIELKKNLIKLTWQNILKEFNAIINEHKYVNEQEKFLIENYISYLSFFGHIEFKGFSFDTLLPMFLVNFFINRISKKGGINFNERGNMKKILAEMFFKNVEWFQGFFNNLKNLFDNQIGAIIENDLGYTVYDYYYNKSNLQPSIPDYYTMFWRGRNSFHLQLSFILNKNAVVNKAIKINEPILLIILHNWKNPWDNVIQNLIIKNQNIKNLNRKDGIISGILFYQNRSVKFYAFQIPLNTFDKYDEQIVRKKLIAPIKKILKRQSR